MLILRVIWEKELSEAPYPAFEKALESRPTENPMREREKTPQNALPSLPHRVLNFRSPERHCADLAKTRSFGRQRGIGNLLSLSSPSFEF